MISQGVFLYSFFKNTALQILKFLRFLLAYLSSFLINSCFSNSSIHQKCQTEIPRCVPPSLHVCDFIFVCVEQNLLKQLHFFYFLNIFISFGVPFSVTVLKILCL